MSVLTGGGSGFHRLNSAVVNNPLDFDTLLRKAHHHKTSTGCSEKSQESEGLKSLSKQSEESEGKDAERSVGTGYEPEVELDSVSLNEMMLRLDCGHVFHLKCVKEWLHFNTSCPNCRQLVKP